ncbi:uncharacterized protein BDCG_17871 [Blastomyces dermatitidis ER-3]|uniref:Secreted peptide n=1 Tax=Ajellomyces dermatitidis (strain ER-3 / ATCC MYA-2586) TaxID=559297 RepID=A0ABX2W0R6_AJEDR|nr:uncharacterized protein BDCG_17871 [Blastomyces dermatitidis ER-3]OAT02976.1 hypothetical protein BDCG_17871 [Blastomyces dermatitidis ER-3]
MAAKKARLKVEAAVSLSRGSIALIATPPPPASLAAAAVVAVPCSGVSFPLPVSLSVSSSFSAPLTTVVTLPPLSVNTVIEE